MAQYLVKRFSDIFGKLKITHSRDLLWFDATQKQLDEYYTEEDKREAKEYKEEEERKSKEKEEKEVEKIVDDCFSQLEHQDLVTKTVKTKAENTIIWKAHCNKEFPFSISNDIIHKIRKHAFSFVLFRGNFTVKVKI